VKASLLTIVRNCHSTAAKQQQRRASVPLPEEHDVQDWQAVIATTPDPESTSIRRDEERTIDRLLSALPEEYREVLLLREIEEMDYREIATVTNVPIGTVMSRLARARAALKARWLQEVNGAPHAVR
jgi:RNA polymerase sigma factor (sigma-70 family)